MTRARITTLDPSSYGRTPWKNGGGVVIDIAGESRPGAAGGWDATLWRFGRTTIPVAAPFSDLAGFDRLLMVVEGRGLVLQTPAGELDVRERFVPVRFAGETRMASRLEAGPVEVVNLLADRSYAAIHLERLEPGDSRVLGRGMHVLYAAVDACALQCGGVPQALAIGHAVRLDCDDPVTMTCAAGSVLLASVCPHGATDRAVREADAASHSSSRNVPNSTLKLAPVPLVTSHGVVPQSADGAT